jgi:hypothetical protein
VPDPRPVNGEDSEVVLSLRLPGSSPATRALTQAQENQVSEVDVLVFDGSDQYLYSSTGYAFSNGTSSETNVAAVRNFTVRLRPTTSPVDLWVIANAHAKLGSIAVGTAKTTLAASLEATESDFGMTPGDVFTPFPMWGTLENVTISTSGLSPNNPVNLTRMVAKINVSLKNTIPQSTFTLTSVHLYNRQTKGRIVPDEGNGHWTYAPAAGPYATDPSLPSPTAKTAGSHRDFLPTSATAVIDTIYTFEAEKGVAYTSTYEQNTCLVVGGKYNASIQTSYYRIDFVDELEASLDLLRNHRYDVEIQSVSGPGFPTQEDALNARPVNITANVIEWNESGMDVVVMDGQYMLSVSRDSINASEDGGTETINIRTDYKDGWTIDPLSVDVTWLHLQAPLSGAKDQTVTLTMQVDAMPIGQYYRIGHFIIKAGRLEMTIKVTQINLALVYDNISSTDSILRTGGNPVSALAHTSSALTLSFTGSYVGSFDVKAYAGQTLVGTNSNTSKTAHPVSVTANETWSPRRITYAYVGTDVPETTIPAANWQRGYTIWGSGAATISRPGGNYVVTVKGDYPSDTQIYAVLQSGGTQVASPVTVTGTPPNGTATLSIGSNGSGGGRTINIMATSASAGPVSTPLFALTQTNTVTEINGPSAIYALQQVYRGEPSESGYLYSGTGAAPSPWQWVTEADLQNTQIVELFKTAVNSGDLYAINYSVAPVDKWSGIFSVADALVVGPNVTSIYITLNYANTYMRIATGTQATIWDIARGGYWYYENPITVSNNQELLAYNGNGARFKIFRLLKKNL